MSNKQKTKIRRILTYCLNITENISKNLSHILRLQSLFDFVFLITVKTLSKMLLLRRMRSYPSKKNFWKREIAS